jgi:hypothetical protein
MPTSRRIDPVAGRERSTLGCENGQRYLFGGGAPSDELFSERSDESNSVCDRTPNALKIAER